MTSSITRPTRTILFQGDSITDAFRKPEEINQSFQLGAGYAFLAASRLIWDYPQIHFQFLNRGISGHSVSAILERWEVDAIAHRPDILTLLAGVNDTIQRVTLEQTAASYRELVSTTLRELPETKLVFFEPFLLPVADVTPEMQADLEARRVLMRGVLEAFGIRWVPLQSLFDAEAAHRPAAELSYDGIHASPAGAMLIAKAWFDAVKPHL